MATGKATAKKTNAATEVVLGQGAQLISKAVTDLKAAATLVIDNMEAKSEELTLQITNKTAQIEDLDSQYAEKYRQKEVEFGLQIKENAEKVVTDHLNANGKVAIAKSDLAALNTELETVKANAKKEADTAVAVVSSKLKSDHEAAIKLLEAEHKAQGIENSSKITTLTEKNTFLEGQVEKLYKQLDAEREASIERAKAGAVGAINVNGATK